MSSIQSILPAAQAARDQGAWQRASDLYRQADQLMPKQAEITHNLALCLLALGQHREAVAVCAETLAIKPGLWQTQVVQAKCEQALGQIEAADQTYCRILEVHPKQASALSGRADLALNFFGDPLAAAALVEPLLAHPDDAMDAQLTQLMARLYDRDPADTAARLAADAKHFAKAHLQLPGPLLTPKAQVGSSAAGRPRVGLLSNQFSVSPVYFLTIAGWQHVAKGCDIILFNRGHQRDWASETFFSLVSTVMDVQHLPALELARAIAAEQIDVLYDLGGWMDPIGLQALSLKPARVQYKWVGGQSMTTGLRCFDGWIGDAQQSPLRLQGLYSEPLINVAGGYARYTPPAYLPTAAANKSATPCIFSNPAKVSRAFLAYLSKLPGKKVFIHRQYRFARTRARIEEVLGAHAVEFICPQSHVEALMALNQHATMIDTFPYSSGLTAYEASALGTRIQCAPQARQGQLFAERHTARFWKVTV
jgi:predicted O-linked N-acetylglucosamine transferase (SPINDLY family)